MNPIFSLPIPSLTIYQPWASLCAIGAKEYETRGRHTKFRGKFLIHAGKKDPYACMDEETAIIAEELFFKAGLSCYFGALPLGAIIAVAELVGCYLIYHPSNQYGYVDDGVISGKIGFMPVSEQEQLFGDWSVGRYAWKLANVQMLDEPIPCRGQQGLWTYEGEKS